MYCKKSQKRTLFDLFKVYDCNGCKYLLEDQNIKIGYNSIRIFYLDNYCCLDKEKVFYNFNNKVNLLFKDIIINEIKEYKNIILWLDYKDNFSNYYYEFEYFLNNGYNIIIII